jgi:methionyl-tRNA formyltransferase
MNRLLILGYGQPVKLIINSLKKETFEVVNVEQDFLRSDPEQNDFEVYLNKKGILHNKLFTLKTLDFDLVLSVNFNKIIDLNAFPAIKIVNLHMGILPRYRGNNANAWAVINGESHVGYTLHEVTDILDGGGIYYKYEYDMSNDDTYAKAKNAIELDIARNINDHLFKIANAELPAVSQAGSPFIYCVKLRRSDGIIVDWNVSSSLLVRKSYVFGKPLGTGLGFRYHDTYYEIEKVSLIREFVTSVGVPGSIVNIRDNRLWVKTGDTAVELSGILVNQQPVEPGKIFKIGMRLIES